MKNSVTTKALNELIEKLEAAAKNLSLWTRNDQLLLDAATVFILTGDSSTARTYLGCIDQSLVNIFDEGWKNIQI